MPTQNQKLLNWCRKQIVNVSEVRGRCVTIVVRHVSKKGTEVATFDIPAGADENDADTIADQIDDAAYEDASSLGGCQTYSAVSYFAKSEDRPVARFSFRMEGNEDADPSEDSTEGPNLKGIAAQQMRHNELLVRLLTTQSTATNMQLAKLVEGYQKRENETFEKRMELLQMAEELMSAKAEREIEIAKEQRKFELQGEIMEKVNLLVPHVIKKMTGGSVSLPAKTVSPLIEIRKTLTPEQIEGISKVLSPEQTVAFIDILQAVDKEQEEQEARVNGKSH